MNIHVAFANECSDIEVRVKKAIDGKSKKTVAGKRTGKASGALHRISQHLYEKLDIFFDQRSIIGFETEKLLNQPKTKKTFLEGHAKGHHYPKFLERLGFEFIHEGPDGGKILVPPYLDIIKNLRAELARAGFPSTKEGWQPVLTWELNGEFLVLEPEKKPPANAIAFGSILPTEVFVGLLVKGQFPLGDESLLNGHTNNFLHDLAHFAGVVEAPKHGAAFVETYRGIQEKWDKHRAANPNVVFKTPFETTKTFLKTHLHGRSFFVTESLSFVPKEKLEHFDFLIPEKRDASAPYTVSQVRAFLESRNLSGAKLAERLTSLSDKVIAHEIALGGVVGDLMSIPYHFEEASDPNTNFYKTLDGLNYRARKLAAKAPEEISKNRAEAHEILAKLQVMILEGAELSPDDWMNEAMQPTTDPNSKFFRFFAKTGLFDAKTQMHNYIIDAPAEALAKTKHLANPQNMTWNEYYKFNEAVKDKPPLSVEKHLVGPAGQIGDYPYFAIRSEQGKIESFFFPADGDAFWTEQIRKTIAAVMLATDLGVAPLPKVEAVKLAIGSEQPRLGMKIDVNEHTDLNSLNSPEFRAVASMVGGEAFLPPHLDGTGADGQFFAKIREKLFKELVNMNSKLKPHLSMDEIIEAEVRIEQHTEKLKEAAHREIATTIASDDQIKAAGYTPERVLPLWKEASEAEMPRAEFEKMLKEKAAEECTF